MQKKLHKYSLGTGHKPLLELGWIYIKFDVTKYCNFECNYCCVNAPKLKKDDSFNYNKDNFHLVIDFLKKQEATGIVFELFGGEPTLHPDLSYFIQELQVNFNPNLKLILMTNLSAPLTLYNSLPDQLELVVGFHSQFNQTERFLKKAVLLNSKFNKIDIVFLIYEKNSTELIPYIDKFRSAGLNISVNPLIDENVFKNLEGFKYDEKYVPNISEVIDKDMNVLCEKDANQYTKFTGMFCFPNINISSNGEIEVCTQKSGQNIRTSGKIRSMVLCSKLECSDCEITNPKLSIEFAKQKGLV